MKRSLRLDQQTENLKLRNVYKEAVYNILNNVLYIFLICKKRSPHVYVWERRSFASSLEHRATFCMYLTQLRPLSQLHKRKTSFK